MPDAESIRWFKESFHEELAAALAGTPFDLDMVAAIACQETGPIWSALRRKGMERGKVLALCVGDTLDADRGRRAFPKTKAELLAAPRGAEMFAIARGALVAMAAHVPSFAAAAARPDKFCHGFGLFQRDLQFFLEDPDYFLGRQYEDFGLCLAHCVKELRRGLRKVGLEGKATLSDEEFASVAIAYNTGGFRPAKGLKQGFFNGERFYGEEVFGFVRLSRTVALPGALPAIAPPAPNRAILPPPTLPGDEPADYVVRTLEAPLRVRSEPRVSDPPGQNVVAHLPDGHPVRRTGGRKADRFWPIETSLFGAHVVGFASSRFLEPAVAPVPIPVLAPAAAPALSAPAVVASVAADPPSAAPVPAHSVAGLPAVLMPRRPGMVTKRSAPAGAHSLNEAGQPAREGGTPAELVRSMAAIVDWLAVERETHLRYRPRAGLTFCNIYAHDACHLAGAYLPRVWWTQRALLDLSAGREVEPRIGATIGEVRANDLFRWLRDFGLDFGWRQTGTLDKLQLAANEGAIGIIVARRKEDGRSGHIALVVAETETERARRSAAGEVVSPLQSQAGATNFRRGTGRANWWRGEEFAESAFWIHA